MTTIVKKDKEDNTKKKRKFKMPSSLAIIVGVVLFVTVLTWIPHNGFGMTDKINELHPGNWQSGSLADWQNYIFWTNVATADPSSTAQDIINTYGLKGNLVNSKGEILNNEIISALVMLPPSGIHFETSMHMSFWLTDFNDGSSSMFGIFDAFKAMIGGYQDAWKVGFYLVAIFSLVILLMESETLKDGISSLVKMLGGREIILVPILFILFAAGGTLFGMQEETLGLLPIVVPVFVAAGFDAPLGLLVAALGTTTGIAASVLDPFSVGVMAGGLGVTIGTAILERLLLFLIYTSIGATFVTMYALRVKKDPKKSLEPDKIEENKIWAEENLGDIHEHSKMSPAQKAALTIFIVVFGWMIFSLLPWTSWFSGLEDSKGWRIFSSIFFGKVLLGDWYFVELGLLFFIASFIVGWLFNKKIPEIINVFWRSLKDMFIVITIIAFSRATSGILQSSGLTFGMVYIMANPDQISNMSPLAFAMIWLLIFTFMAIFIPSTSGLAGITAPLAGGFISSQPPGSHTSLMIIGVLMVYPLAQGVINMFSPTTGLIVIQAEQSKTSYGKVLPVLAGYAAVIFLVGIISISLIMTGEIAIS